tara:strand:- start:1354 stop:1638 length:285 start_codon:yes stop_codon:yes gene_type:complete
MPVDNIKKRALHKTAHHLDPTVWVGKNGITENVIKEIICTLEDHELIKIKMLHSDKKNFEKNSEKIYVSTNAEVINSIGNVLTIYKKNTKIPKK